jgi:hypothetical protein
MAAQASNPIYMGGGDPEDQGFRPGQAKSK